MGLSTERADGVVESVFVGADKSYSQQMSDVWNSPISRAIVPDKIGLSLSASITAYAGMSTGLNFDWITRGHDASVSPYVTFTVGGQGGGKVMADALIGIGVGTYATTDMRSLRPGEAAKNLLGWSAYGSGGAGIGLGGSMTGSVGFSGSPLVTSPTWISGSINGGAAIGAGVTGGISYTFPVFMSQFNKK